MSFVMVCPHFAHRTDSDMVQVVHESKLSQTHMLSSEDRSREIQYSRFVSIRSQCWLSCIGLFTVGSRLCTFCSLDFQTLRDQRAAPPSEPYCCLHVTVPNPFFTSCTFKLSFLHQFCMHLLQIKTFRSYVCNLGTCRIIFHVFGCQRVVSKVKQLLQTEVCLWISWNFACTCPYMYFRCSEVLENFR